jgi:hypothetical protein
VRDRSSPSTNAPNKQMDREALRLGLAVAVLIDAASPERSGVDR